MYALNQYEVQKSHDELYVFVISVSFYYALIMAS